MRKRYNNSLMMSLLCDETCRRISNAWIIYLLHTKLVLNSVWKGTAHAQKQDLVFQWNGRVHLNRVVWRQFSRLLAAEVCASAVVMLDTPCSEGQCKSTVYPLHSPVLPFASPTAHHRVPSHYNWSLQVKCHITHSTYNVKVKNLSFSLTVVF